MIVKLQRQTYPNQNSLDILIYNEDQTILTIQKMAFRDIDHIFHDERKIYAEAHLEGTIIVIDAIIPDQPW